MFNRFHFDIEEDIQNDKFYDDVFNDFVLHIYFNLLPATIMTTGRVLQKFQHAFVFLCGKTRFSPGFHCRPICPFLNP